MKKTKEMFKKFIDKLIIKNREFIEDYYDQLVIGSILLFITTSLITPFINAPLTMFTILVVEILIVFLLTHFDDYIDEILSKDYDDGTKN